MKSLGGFLELETNLNTEYHSGLLRFNSGRNALKVLLHSVDANKIFVPYFICQVVIDAIKEFPIEIEYYEIDDNFEIDFGKKMIPTDAWVICVNYFGIKQEYIKSLSFANLIIDNSQAFFSKPIPSNHTFYSPRKFLGVPDGGYLSTSVEIKSNYPQDNSNERFSHLLKRVELGPEKAYLDFLKNEDLISEMKVLKMSKLTSKILNSVCTDTIINRRKENYKIYDSLLKEHNICQLSIHENDVPLGYIFVSKKKKKKKKKNLRQILLQNKVYVPVYWPNLNTEFGENSLAHKLSEKLYCLPIDQGLDINDINKISNLILKA